MDLSEIGGACEVDQLLSFSWLPNETFHLGREENIDLVLPNEFDQSLEIGTLFLGILRCTDIILFKNYDDFNSQGAILGIAPGFLEAFDNLD